MPSSSSSSSLPIRLHGIVGHPLGHTLSPLVHNWGFRHYGIPGVYLAWPVEPGRLADFVTAVRVLGIAGVSVTIPHKTAIMPFLDVITDRSRAVGAVNTLFWRDGQLLGENTDVAGFVRPLVERGFSPASALVLGCGGAARAAVAGLRELAVPDVRVSNRTPERAEGLRRDFGVEFVPWEKRGDFGGGLVVNATPLGMLGQNEGLSPMPREALGPSVVAFDLVYNPYRTQFVRDAAAAGAQVIVGLEMFFWQAVEQFRLWTGRTLPRDEVWELLRTELEG